MYHFFSRRRMGVLNQCILPAIMFYVVMLSANVPLLAAATAAEDPLAAKQPARVPAFHAGPAKEDGKPPARPESLAIQALEADTQQKIAAVRRRCATDASGEGEMKAQKEIEAIKASAELLMLETSLEFADRVGDIDRVQLLLVQIDDLTIKTAPKESSAAVAKPQLDRPSQPGPHGEVR